MQISAAEQANPSPKARGGLAWQRPRRSSRFRPQIFRASLPLPHQRQQSSGRQTAARFLYRGAAPGRCWTNLRYLEGSTGGGPSGEVAAVTPACFSLTEGTRQAGRNEEHHLLPASLGSAVFETKQYLD